MSYSVPIYVFESPIGDCIEELFSVENCPMQLLRDNQVYRRVISQASYCIGQNMMEQSDYDKKFGKGASSLLASDRDYRAKTKGKAADAGFVGPEWLRPKQ